MSVKFTDNRIQVKSAINDKSIAFLHKAKETLVSQTVRNTPSDTGELKRSFTNDSYVDENNLIAYIGSSLEYSIYVELGTGIHAVNGNGRKGYWVYVEDSNSSKKSTKHYTLEEAKETASYLRSKGLKAYYTNGRPAKRMLYRAYQTKKSEVLQTANTMFKELSE